MMRLHWGDTAVCERRICDEIVLENGYVTKNPYHEITLGKKLDSSYM